MIVPYSLCHKYTSSDKKHKKLTSEIEKILKSLKSEDARGYHEIFASLLKISSPFINSPLNYICNVKFLL
jgi:hypothetical protein